jgi:hypothetical protein
LLNVEAENPNPRIFLKAYVSSNVFLFVLTTYVTLLLSVVNLRV